MLSCLRVVPSLRQIDTNANNIVIFIGKNVYSAVAIHVESSAVWILSDPVFPTPKLLDILQVRDAWLGVGVYGAKDSIAPSRS